MMGTRPNIRLMARRGARGFSLLELTLVLAIIGILMAVAAVSIFGQGENARIKATVASMSVIKNAIQQYQLSNSAYPATLTALQQGRTPLLDPDKPLVDGWNQPFLYAVPGRDNRPFDLISKGANGTLESGTGDDISVWNPPKN